MHTAADEVESICRLLVLGDEEEVVGGGGDDARLKKPVRGRENPEPVLELGMEML